MKNGSLAFGCVVDRLPAWSHKPGHPRTRACGAAPAGLPRPDRSAPPRNPMDRRNDRADGVTGVSDVWVKIPGSTPDKTNKSIAAQRPARSTFDGFPAYPTAKGHRPCDRTQPRDARSVSAPYRRCAGQVSRAWRTLVCEPRAWLRRADRRRQDEDQGDPRTEY